ncbi:oligopeptide transport system ATP-binding protein [Butyrivibrio sp. ob235]|uniref:ABC transporter ATP-binding protein n=1 Tax=Butyrivibrio sp. ob235 TaxID=1761780 RepID=UPI0008C18930|nr:ATP-binding cassette domain-containing protein [Butyrivibrio sp. ob235]SEK48538.1 oligopeptide transport system ATP-binding protein [Butyrivibrio sp. ob235]
MSMSDTRASEPLLKVEDLIMRFGNGRNSFTAVNKVSFSINKGEIYGLVGESGSGKSTIGKCVIGLNRSTSGKIYFEGKELRSICPEIQMIFQDPMSSLNPKKKIKDIVGAGLDIHKLYSSMEERDGMISEVLETVGLSKEQAERYPGQFSGGQRQRVGIARALIMKPKLIVADECIAALDASVQAQIVNMISRICRETGTAFLFISHDLSMVRYLCQRIGVLHRGYLLETGEEEEIFKNPAHPYTRNLLAANPIPNPIVQFKKDEHYDYETSGILYENGFWHDVNGNEKHKVWCTDSEFEKWGLSI